MNNNEIITRIATNIYRKIFPYLLAVISLLEYAWKGRKYHALWAVNTGFADHRHTQKRISGYSLCRLVDAYHEAKLYQCGVTKPYQVGYLWQEILDTRFKELTVALSELKMKRIRALLENFNREDCGDDTCGGGQHYQRMRDIPFYKYQFINAWYKRYNACSRVLGYRPKFDIPNIGNPVGLNFSGNIVPLCNVEYRCYAEEIRILLNAIPRPVICEIGGGVGGQAYETIKNNPPLTYILLDIPEVLLLSSYYLMMAYPDKRMLLYGEGEIDTNNYDIILLPNFALPQIDDCSVDLVFNSCSFSEMDYSTMREYISQIERICKTYLMHINHNARLVWYENKSRITNMIADEVKPVGFELEAKEPRLFSLLEDAFVIQLYYRASYYKYLFRRGANRERIPR